MKGLPWGSPSDHTLIQHAKCQMLAVRALRCMAVSRKALLEAAAFYTENTSHTLCSIQQRTCRAVDSVLHNGKTPGHQCACA